MAMLAVSRNEDMTGYGRHRQELHASTHARSRPAGFPMRPWSARTAGRTDVSSRADGHRRPASAQPAAARRRADPRRTFRPRSARNPPVQKPAGSPRAPAAWAYNIAGLQPQPPTASVRARPQSARPASGGGGRHAALVAQQQQQQRPKSAHDHRWTAVRAAERDSQAQADVLAIGKEKFMPPFPKFEEQPPADEMAEIVAKAGVQWARHYAPLSNARTIKRWPRTRHGDSFELVPGVDRNAGDHVKMPERVGSPKPVTGRAAARTADEPSDTLEHTINMGGVDAAAAVVRRLARSAVHHGCGYAPGQPVAAMESDYEPTETESVISSESEYSGVWKNGHRCHSSKQEDTAARLIQAMLRGRKARRRAEGLRIERDLGLQGTPEERAQIEKLQARQRGRAVRKQIKEDTDQKTAVTKIAAAQRGKKDRRKVEKMKIEKNLGLDGSELQDEAAARMQALHRSKQAKIFVAELKAKKIEEDLGLTGSKEEQERIAKMQAVQRGKQARKELAEQNEAASRMQAVQRGKEGRKKALGKRIEKELGLTGSSEEAERIAKLQAVQRGKQARREVAQTKAEQAEAATKIAAVRRGKHDRAKVAGMKLERDMGLTGSPEEAERIAKLQAVQRGKQARKELAEQNEAATRVQAMTRGKQDRKRLRQEKELELKLPTRRRLPLVMDASSYSFLARGSIEGVEAPTSEIQEAEPEPEPEQEQDKEDAEEQEGDAVIAEADAVESEPVHVYSGYTLRELRRLQLNGQLTDETVVWREVAAPDATGDAAAAAAAAAGDEIAIATSDDQMTLLELLAQHKAAVILALQFRLRLRRAHETLPRNALEPRAYLPTAVGYRKLFLRDAMAHDIAVTEASLENAKAEEQQADAELKAVLEEKKVTKGRKKRVGKAEEALGTATARVAELETTLASLRDGGTVAAMHFIAGLNALELGLSVDDLDEIVQVFAAEPDAAEEEEEEEEEADADAPDETSSQLDAEPAAEALAQEEPAATMVATETFLSTICVLDDEANAFADAYEAATREPSFVYEPTELAPPPPPARERKLKIHVGRCLDNLPKSDAVGNPDPYVRLSWLGTDLVVSTDHINNDRTAPEWNQTVELPLPEKAGLPLRVEVVDSDALHGSQQHSDRDDVLATGLIDVRSQLDAVEGWERASWSSALVGGEEVKQLQLSSAEVGKLVAPLQTCAITVGAKTSKAGLPVAVTLSMSVV
jgi:hypothetical protein